MRKYIEAGLLGAALRPDGRIDADAADAALAAAKTAGGQVSSGLLKARVRKLAAGCALLEDEIAELEAGVVPAAGVAALTRDLTMHMVKALSPIANMAARLAGLEPTAAMAALESEIADRLQAIADTRVQAPRSKGREVQDGPALSELSPVDLAARRAELQARRLEIQRAVRTGTMLHLAQATAVAVERVMKCKQRLLALPSKIGAGFSGVVDEAELRPMLQEEVKQALAELASDACPVSEIEAARDQAAEPEPGRRLTFRLQHQQGKVTT